LAGRRIGGAKNWRGEELAGRRIGGAKSPWGEGSRTGPTRVVAVVPGCRLNLECDDHSHEAVPG
jgi:hypothetical protein